MKYIKANKYALFILNPITAIVGLLLFWHHLNYILSTFYAFWLSSAIALLLIITPLGNKRLCINHDDVAKRIPFAKWLFRIVLLELSVIGAYAGICLISGTYFPIMTTPHPNLFIDTLAKSATIGAFPWPIYTIIAISMGVIAYRKQKNAFFSTLLGPFANDNPQDKISAIANVGARRCTMFAISTSILFMTMLLLSLLLSADIHLTYGFNPAGLFTTLVILVLSLSENVKKYVGRFFVRKTPITWGVFTFCLLFGFSIFLINIMLSGMTHQVAPTTSQLPKIIERLINKNWHSCWTMFSLTWAITLTPIIASHIANISKGYRVRDIVIATLALPVLITLGAFYSHQTMTQLPTLSPLIAKVITFIAFWTFLSIILKKNKRYPI